MSLLGGGVSARSKGLSLIDIFKNKRNTEQTKSSLKLFVPNKKSKVAFTLAEVFSTHFKNNRKKAFTLAEVLITLGIIGVVAALTLPNIVAHYKEQQLVSRLKKAYSVMNQALKMSELENGEYEHWEETSSAKEYVEKYWKPYLKGIKTCETYSECNYKESYPYKNLNTERCSTAVAGTGRVPIITSDGIMYTFSWKYGSTDGGMISHNTVFVDLNGSRRPNTLGKDLFFFVRVANKGIQPYGYNKSIEEIESNCSPTNQGTYCAAKIIKDGWKVKYNFN